MSRPVVTDRRWALFGGIAGILAGGWLLGQAFEARGTNRPAWVRLLPGA